MRKGSRHTEESIAKMVGNTRALGYKHTPEALTKIREARQRQAAPSADTRAKMSASQMGHLVSEDQRAKLSAINTGRILNPLSDDYSTLHYRVRSARGKASIHTCACGDPAEQWANLTGNYADVADYEAMCRRCHVAFDKEGH
jgi:hypothetical protein